MSLPNGNYRRVGKRPAATVDECQHSLDLVMRTRTARHSKNKPAKSRTGRPTFIDDFLLEHSRFGQQADSIEFVGCF